METILEQIKTTIASAIELITVQKTTISDLKTQLASTSAEYASFLEEEGIEDAETEAFLEKLGEISNTLSTVVSEVSVDE